MDRETRLEAKLRTLELDSQNIASAQHDAAELAFIRVMRQKTYTVDGITRNIESGRRGQFRRIALYRRKTAQIYSENIDISKDAINQLRALDRDA